MLISGDVPPHVANQEFLSLLDLKNPNYTGWPIWLISRGFSDKSSRPYVFENVWEELIYSFNTGMINELDFMRFDPKGKFYLRRAFKEDTSDAQNAFRPRTRLDFSLPILRVAETLAVGNTFAKGMGCNPENTKAEYVFRWTGLKDRMLFFLG